MGATGLLNKGGGSNRLPGLVTKQQVVEFPQVLTSNNECVFTVQHLLGVPPVKGLARSQVMQFADYIIMSLHMAL